MNDVLYCLCFHCVSIMDGWFPFPSTILSKQCGLSLYKTRKILKELKAQGLVDSLHYCYVGEDRNVLVNGYTITPKAKETEEYRAAYNYEREICKKCFNIDIGDIGQEYYWK